MLVQPRPRRPRWLLGSMGLLAFLGILFLLFNRLVEMELKPLIIKGLEKAAQGPVALSSVGGNLAGDVVLRDLTMDLPGSPWRVHLQANQVSVNLDLLNLLLNKKPLENCVRSLTIVKPLITLIRVQPPIQMTTFPASVSMLTPVSSSFPLPVFLVPAPRLFVKEGSLLVKAGKDTQNLVTGVDFEAFSNDGNDWSLVLSAQPADPAAGGSLRFTGSLHLDILKLSGKAQLTDWPLVQAGALLQDLAGWQLTGGKLDAECPLVYQPDRGLWFDTRVNLHDASIVSPKPLAAQFDQINGKISVRTNEIEIPGDLTFSTGGTPWLAHGLIPFDGKPIQVHASTGDLLLSSLSTGLLKLKGTPWEGHGKASLVVEGTFQKPFLTAEANLGPSKLGDIVLDGFKSQAHYEEGNLQLTHLEGNLYDGYFSAQGQIGLTGQEDAPISIIADLKDVDTGKLFLSFGLKELFGKTQAQINLSGTLNNLVYSIANHIDFDSTETHDAYSIQNNIKMDAGVLILKSTINGQDQMKGVIHETTDGWKVDQADLTFPKNGGHLTASGVWPKDPDQPIDLTIKGKGIALEQLPLFRERFHDVKGQVDVTVQFFGTKHNPMVSALLSGQDVTVANLPPSPISGNLLWTPVALSFKNLELGQIVAVQGNLGMGEESLLDLKIQAEGIPVQTLAELSGWSNPPQIFDGLLTGRLHLSGLKKNPIVEGNAVVTRLKFGDWWADQVEISMNRDQGKLIVRKLKLTQGSNSLIASGTWDTTTQPGLMNMRFFAKNFQTGKGPFLSGNFLWEAQTGETWFKNWTGSFSADGFSLGDGKNNFYSFPRLTLESSSQNYLLDGKFQLGDSVEGRANLNMNLQEPTLKGSITISPTLISKMPELAQFIPSSMKVNGTVSGKIHFGPGSWKTLPLSGDLHIADGVIAKRFTFENLGLTFEGNRTHLEPTFKLENKKSTYALAGTLDSTKGFWDPDCKVALKGPFNDSLDRLILFFPELDPTKHRIGGSFKGDLTLGGTWSKLNFDFSMNGDSLQFDDNQVVSGLLHCGYSDGRMFVDNCRLTLPKGQINIERGSLVFDPSDTSHLSLSITGSTQNLSISLFQLSNRINLSGDLFLNESAEKPTFAGSLSIFDSDPKAPKTNPFELNIRVKHNVIELLPLSVPKPQLVGVLDLSQQDKIIFQQLKLMNAPGAFSVDGTLDLKGDSHLTSDARNIPIQDVGKWILPDFPLMGMANYHMVIDGSLSHPLMTSSLIVNGGQVGKLKFDLLTADLKAKNDTLYLGSEDAPVEVSQSGLYNFTVFGELPLALTASTRLETKNREMDITAKMDKGDFSILLAAGLAKEAQGSINFDAHFNGTLDDPLVSTLDLGLSNCRMVPSMIAQSLDDINGRIKVRDNKLAVEDLNFQVGQGRVFITSPPIEKSKMVLDNFVPQYLDFMVRTVGDHGLWLNVPDIMAKGEWGEIYFYGQTPEDPMLIRGSINEPHVIGTALLDTGHYTFPPVPTNDENGKPIEYRELANVYFELNLVSGKNTWYDNDSNTNYLHLKVDPGDVITIEGKDSNRTEEEAGIKCHGAPGSSVGTLRYLSHEFKLQDARLDIPLGKLPVMEGHATDKFPDVELVTPGGSVEHTDMDVYLTFKGTFGDINFTLDSNPRFSTNDKDIQQRVLLSYIMFGRDMTGYSGQAYSSQQLQTIYQQNAGQVILPAVVDAINRIGTNYISQQIRPFFSSNFGIDAQIKGNPIGGGSGPNSSPTTGVQAPEPAGNTLAGSALPLVQLQLIKPIDRRFAIETNVGLGRDIYSGQPEWQGRLGLDVTINPKLNLSFSVGQNDLNQTDTRGEFRIKQDLPDMISPKLGDKEKPRFERSEYYPMGKGKYHLVWELDKTNRSEVRVFDSNGTMTQVISDKSGWDYKHETDVENLNENQDYKILISAKDPNGNEATAILKIPAISD